LQLILLAPYLPSTSLHSGGAEDSASIFSGGDEDSKPETSVLATYVMRLVNEIDTARQRVGGHLHLMPRKWHLASQ
jgi:hypothetical protein